MNEVMRVEQLPPPASAQQPPGGSKHYASITSASIPHHSIQHPPCTVRHSQSTIDFHLDSVPISGRDVAPHSFAAHRLSNQSTGLVRHELIPPPKYPPTKSPNAQHVRLPTVINLGQADVLGHRRRRASSGGGGGRVADRGQHGWDQQATTHLDRVSITIESRCRRS